MSLITPTMRAAMRADLEAWMTSTATIQRQVTASDGAFGQTTTPTPVLTSKCRVRPKRSSTPQERVIGERLAAIQQWAITFPAETDVRETDRLLIAGRTYEVVGVHGPKSDELSRQAVCIEVH